MRSIRFILKHPEEKSKKKLEEALAIFTGERSRIKRAYEEIAEDLDRTAEELVNLREAAGDFLSIFSLMSQGLVLLDAKGVVLFFNPAAEKFLNADSKQVAGASFSSVFPDELLGFSMREALKGGGVRKTHEVAMGAERVEIDATPLFDDEEKFDGIAILIRNVTPLRRLEQLVSRRSRLEEIGELASVIGHEIRNPLAAIKGFAELLARDLQEMPRQHKMATKIKEGIDDLNSILTHLLNYTHPKLLKLERAEIGDVVEGAIGLALGDPGVREKADISLHGIGFSATIDKTHIRSLLYNLILNSVEAMEEKGRIDISLSEENGDGVIRVKDTGKGIPSKLLRKIFQPFFTTKPGGNGFGLAESKRIVEAHQGSIEVKSEQGKGTEIIIHLPKEHQ